MAERARKELEVDTVTPSSGNVFDDLGFANAEELLAKAQLVHALSNVMKAKRLTQEKIAEELGIDQPQVSRLLRGHTTGYSVERLLRFLNQLGQDVEIMVRAKPEGDSRAPYVRVVERFSA